MRKILVTAFAAIATVSVFANNFITVSAPSQGVEVGHLDTRSIPAIAEQPVPATKVNRAADPDSPAAETPAVATLPEAVTEVAPEIKTPEVPPVIAHELTAAVPEMKTPDAPPIIEHELAGAAPVKPVFERASTSRFVSEWLEVPAVVLRKLNVIAAPSAEPEAVESTVVSVEAEVASAAEVATPKLSGLIASLAFAPASLYDGVINFANVRAPAGIFAGVDDKYLSITPLEQISELAAVTEPITPQLIDTSELAIGNATASSVLPQETRDFLGREFLAVRETAAPESNELTEADVAIGNSIATAILPETPREIVAPARPERNSGYFPMFVAAVFEAPVRLYKTLVGTEETLEIQNAVPAVETIKETAAPQEMKTQDLLSPGNATLGTRIAEIAIPEPPVQPIASMVSGPQMLFFNEESAKTVDTTLPIPFNASTLQASSQSVLEYIQNRPLPTAPLDPAALPSNYLSVLNADDPPRAFYTKTTEPAKTQAPVLISQNAEFSQSMLRPMNSTPIFEKASAPLAASDKASFLDSIISSPVTASRPSDTTSLLITGRNEMSLDLLKPMKAAPAQRNVPQSSSRFSAPASTAVQDDSFCDPAFVGPPIRFTQTVELTLDDLIRQLHSRFGVNFIMGSNIANLPLSVRAGNIPWNVLLKSQLFVSGVRARCIDANTIELVKNEALSNLQDMADVNTRFVKLTFLQRTGGGTVDLAGRSQGGGQGGQGGCGGSAQGGQSGGLGSSGGSGGGQTGETASQQASSKFDKLIIEIEKILGIRSMTESSVGGGGQGGGQVGSREGEAVRTNRFVTQIPGRNILAIRATDEEHLLIQQIIDRADRPPFQVVIKGLVYSANQDRLTDIGLQTTIFGETGDGRTGGGIFGHTLGGAGTLFDFSTIIGTVDFNVQATALQQKGVISVKSRPFAVVLDGLCATLNVGRELPIVIDSTLGGQGDVIFVNAANNLAVAPYVVDDAAGNPLAVTLELRLEANDVDSTISARGVPAISTRSVQTQLLLGEDQTAILGGFTVDQDSRSVSKTPGLGDIPIIGELFKRRVRDTRVNRLYFAISVTVIPFGQPITPVNVPGATTQPPSITPEQLKRGKEAPSVVAPKPSGT